MKLINSKLAAAILVAGSASSAMAGVYEFEFDNAATGFQPTYVWVSVALNTPTSISTAIKKFSITTPEGTWTSGQFLPNSPIAGQTIGTPFWATGTVEVTDSGNTLLFTSGGLLEAAVPAPPTGPTVPQTVISPTGDWSVSLTTGHISDSTYLGTSVTDANGNGSDGKWVAVNPVAVRTVPDIASTGGLLFAALGLMGAFQYFQRRSAVKA